MRPGIVYAILTKHDRTGKVGVGYIGQTRQALEARIAQHRMSQPWSDRIVRVMVVDRGDWTDAQLDRAEITAIRRGIIVPEVSRSRQRPWYNIDHNMDNRRRVKPWDAVRWRREREPGWKPTKVWKDRKRPVKRGWFGWLMVWGLLFTAASLWVDPVLSGDTQLVVSAGLASLPFAGWWGWRKWFGQ